MPETPLHENPAAPFDQDARIRGALKAGETLKTEAKGTLAQRRSRQAAEHARELYRSVSGSPALRTGAALEPAEVKALVTDHVTDAGIPASLRSEAISTATKLVEMVAGGNRLEADRLARESSVQFGERLAKSSWSEQDDDFSPSEIAARIQR